MTARPAPKITLSFNAEPTSIECREIDTIPRRVAFLSGLIRRNGGEEWAASYIRARSSSVQVGLHTTVESNYDGSGVEVGEAVEIVRTSCPEPALRCATCILNLSAADLNGVEPKEIVDGLNKITTPHLAFITHD